MKKFQIFFFTVIVLLSLRLFLCDTVYAETYGDYEYRILSNGTVEIVDWRGNDTRASIPREIDGRNVTRIGDMAFSYCSGLNNIEIPNSVISIGQYSFFWCSGLNNIEIPNSVTSIGRCAFSGCSLMSLVIPASVSSIGNRVFESAFYDCGNLEYIFVSTENTTFESRYSNAIIDKSTNELVLGCQNTIIPNSVTSIGAYAFSNCSGLNSIEIPSSVTYIGSYAFSNCRGLTSMELPNSGASIGTYAFSGCSGLTSIEIPGNTGFSSGVFSNCRGLTSIKIPSTVDFIPDRVFLGCRNLKEVLYQGTENDWNNISIWDDNEPLLNANIYYSGYLTLTYEPQNGTPVFVQHYNPGENLILPDTPSKDNYIFQGWYTEPNGNGTKYDNGMDVSSDAFLYAKWESSKASEPEEKKVPVDDNRRTITASSGGYKVVISMNRIVPYTKNKKAVVNSLDITSTIEDADGKPCGIYIKSIKATKPKRGYSKVTFKLKGSNKIEKKAVKAMNKSLKKIKVNVETN